MRKKIFAAMLMCLTMMVARAQDDTYIRINQLGYIPQSCKVAVFMSTGEKAPSTFSIADASTGKTVFTSKRQELRPTGPLGLMKCTCRLDFSRFETPGTYYIKAGNARSEQFRIGGDVYDGSADFVLNYMRQQRCGWNPFLRDSCHVLDGFITNHPEKEGQHLDVRGGWHDASDCLQYLTTSANAVYQMMFAYQQNPEAFGDNFLEDGTPGQNGIPDIVDEIRWGLEWMDKMNPQPGEYYNQIADDRDHAGMRLPSKDMADYGRGPGNERPVYFIDGKPQQRGKFMNATTGVASSVAKFASDFALGSEILAPFYPEFAQKIREKAEDAYKFAAAGPGCCQTVSVVSPYIYEEENWVDDMELGAMEMYRISGDRNYVFQAVEYGRREPVTPWMGADSTRHYQWYPFMNMGHYHLAVAGGGKVSEEFTRNIRSGIQRTYERAQSSPFLYGIPAVWCSNNLTTAMLTQCILYRQLTGDDSFMEMEAALRDWLLGCNPWGVSMIAGLPSGGRYPEQPHSFIVQMGLGNTTGGLVDGPVHETIFSSLRGIHTTGGNNYMDVQPGDMVYHDSTNDYSTNEPTMDGTACLTFPLSSYEAEGHKQQKR